ncbi:MAG: glycosyltransferase family 2 protein [Steroidobacteraceae bacterium]
MTTIQGAADATEADAESPKLSIVVPCFNESRNLPNLHGRCTAVARSVAGNSYELILVDDGSRDSTWQLMQSLAAVDGHVVAARLSRNFGHQLALSAGLQLSCGDRVLIVDADLQDPPELLPRMMEAMDRGNDVVYGRRKTRQGETWFKRATAALFYRGLRLLTDVEIPMDAGDFRLVTRRVVILLAEMPEQHRFIRGMVSWIGLRQESVIYDRDERVHGTTSYSARRMLRLALDAVTSFSTRPLRIASLIGLGFSALGFVGVAYAIFGWATGQTLPGWTSVIVVILLLGGIQLFVVGILGEYLGRLYLEAKRRPLYVIQEVVRTARLESVDHGPQAIPGFTE